MLKRVDIKMQWFKIGLADPAIGQDKKKIDTTRIVYRAHYKDIMSIYIYIYIIQQQEQRKHTRYYAKSTEQLL